ncbi:MAG: hypothetical protein U0798_11005 [Gemmataceae bacterium]
MSGQRDKRVTQFLNSVVVTLHFNFNVALFSEQIQQIEQKTGHSTRYYCCEFNSETGIIGIFNVIQGTEFGRGLFVGKRGQRKASISPDYLEQVLLKAT